MDKSNDSYSVGRFFGKKLMLVLIIALALTIIFIVLLFGIFHMAVPTDHNSNLLPANCYSINGKQICPK
ncbi:MAG TPA: hypothetical protein VJM74_05705 [Nitrososphaeraceae archaeon]|nr:hypothetical protein [Nitrososphaeraceae archaeon]